MKAWIFQGNPTKFKVGQYLLSKKEILWLVRPERYAKQVGPGDLAFIWRSDGLQRGSGGVVAQGEVLDAPATLEDDAPDLWISPITTPCALRVRIGILEKRLSPGAGMLLRTGLKGHPTLKGLWVLKWTSQTLYPIGGAQLHDLLALWQESRVG